MNKVNLYIININEARDYYEAMYNQIALFRKERADSYYHDDDKLRSVSAAYLIKKYVKNEKLKYNEYGKPYVNNGLYFNISHSQNFVVLATSEFYEVGVDIEAIEKKDLSFLERIFLPGEMNKDNIKETYLLWCNKESLVKCLGHGLRDIKEAPASPLNGSRLYKGVSYETISFTYMKYAFSITIRSSEKFEVKKKIVKISKDFTK